MSFHSSHFKTSFLVGDIMTGKLKARDPLPDLSCEESKQLRGQLLQEISWLREFGEPEGSKKVQRLIDRIRESLDNDDRRLGRGGPVSDKGKGVVKPDTIADKKTQFAFVDVTGITMVLNLTNFTDERLLDMYSTIKAQVLSRNLLLPDMDLHAFSAARTIISASMAPKQFISSNEDEFDGQMRSTAKNPSLAEELSAVTSTTGSELGDEELSAINVTTDDDLDSQVFDGLEASAPTHPTDTKRPRNIGRYTATACSIFAILASVFRLIILGILVGIAVKHWKEGQFSQKYLSDVIERAGIEVIAFVAAGFGIVGKLAIDSLAGLA